MKKLRTITSVILLLTVFMPMVYAQNSSTNAGLSAYSVKRAVQGVNVNDKWNDAAWKVV